jgi:hypothetical protein
LPVPCHLIPTLLRVFLNIFPHLGEPQLPTAVGSGNNSQITQKEADDSNMFVHVSNT